MFKWIILTILLLFIYHIREVFPPFIVGGIFAYLLAPIVQYLNHKWRLAPFWSVLLLYSVTCTLLGLVVVKFSPVLTDQVQTLFENRTDILVNLLEQLSPAVGMNIDVNQTADWVLNEVQHSVGKPEEIMHLGGLLSKGLLSLLVCAVTSIYMLVDSARVGRFFLRFIPADKRPTVVALSGQMDVMFRKYVYGQVFLICFMSILSGCILWFGFHLKYTLVIALLTGFLEIIPVLGPLLAIMIATSFGIAQLGLAKAGWIALFYWIARLFEDYVVVPNTIGHAVELHPLAVIFAVVVGETMAGGLGMLIAIPVAAAFKVVIDFCYPPTVHPASHEKKDPLAAFLKLFKRQASTPMSEAEAQARLDLEAIESMHEGTSRTGALERVPTRSAESTSQPVAPATPQAVPVILQTQPPQAPSQAVLQTAHQQAPEAIPNAVSQTAEHDAPKQETSVVEESTKPPLEQSTAGSAADPAQQATENSRKSSEKTPQKQVPDSAKQSVSEPLAQSRNIAAPATLKNESVEKSSPEKHAPDMVPASIETAATNTATPLQNDVATLEKSANALPEKPVGTIAESNSAGKKNGQGDAQLTQSPAKESKASESKKSDDGNHNSAKKA